MNQSVSNFKLLKQQDPSMFSKVIDHNKIYLKTGINLQKNYNDINLSLQKQNKSNKEKERLNDILKTKHDKKNPSNKIQKTDSKFKKPLVSTSCHKGTANFDETKHYSNDNLLDKSKYHTLSERETNEFKYDEDCINRRLSQLPDENNIRHFSNLDEMNLKNEHYGMSKIIDDQNNKLIKLQEENMFLKEKIEVLIKEKENHKFNELKIISFKEIFCNEAIDFLEFLKSIDKAFHLNYSLLNPLEFNDSQLQIFFKNLKQNIAPIKRILEEHQEELRSLKNQNDILLKRLGNSNIKSNIKFKNENEFLSKLSNIPNNENSHHSSRGFTERTLNINKKSLSPNNKNLKLLENVEGLLKKKNERINI